MPALPLLFASALAASPVPLSVGLHALLFSLPAVNEDAAMDIVGRSQVGLSDFVGMNPPRPSKAVVVHFFDRAHGGDSLALARPTSVATAVAACRYWASVGTRVTWRAVHLAEGRKPGYLLLRDNHKVVSGRYGVEELPLTVVVIQTATSSPSASPREKAETEPSLSWSHRQVGTGREERPRECPNLERAHLGQMRGPGPHRRRRAPPSRCPCPPMGGGPVHGMRFAGSRNG